MTGILPVSPFVRQSFANLFLASMGKKFYLVHDPRIGIQHLIDTGKIAGDELEDLNQLCSDLKQEPFEVPRKLVRRPASEAAAEPEIQERA
jgi:hypothetical protein